MTEPPVCQARANAWKRLHQADRAQLLKGFESYGARLMACPTCSAKARKSCNPVRR
jgi:hypothetical protein